MATQIKPRAIRNDIKAIRLTRSTVELTPIQYFCETAGAFEIWQKRTSDKLEHCVKRIPRKSVVFVYTK